MDEPDADHAKEKLFRDDLKRFGKSVRNHWAEVAGGSFTLIAASWLSTMGFSFNPMLVGSIVFGLCLGLACFFAFRDQCRLLDELLPKVRIEIGDPIDGLLTAKITNRGHAAEQIVEVYLNCAKGTFAQRAILNGKSTDFPYLLSARSALPVAFFHSLGTYQAHGIGEYWAEAILFDGTKILSTIVKVPDVPPVDSASEVLN